MALYSRRGAVRHLNQATCIIGSNPRSPKQDCRSCGFTIFAILARRCCLRTGASAKQVQALLGHSRVGTTLDTYTHITPATLDDTAARIDAILG